VVNFHVIKLCEYTIDACFVSFGLMRDPSKEIYGVMLMLLHVVSCEAEKITWKSWNIELQLSIWCKACIALLLALRSERSFRVFVWPFASCFTSRRPCMKDQHRLASE